MTAGHLIADTDLSLLCNIDTNRLRYARSQLVAVFSCKYLCVYNYTVCAMRYLKGSITYFSSLLTEDCTEKSLLCSELSLSLRSNLTNENIAGTNLGTNADDSTLIKVLQSVLTYTRNIGCDLFRSKLGITCFTLIFLNVNGSEYIVLYKLLGQKDSILVVVAFPCHESDQRVLTKGNFTLTCRRTICNNIASLYVIAGKNDRLLVVTVRLVGTHELGELILIEFTGCIAADCDLVGCRDLYHTIILCNHTYTGVDSCLCRNTGIYYCSFCDKQRHGLTLHV